MDLKSIYFKDYNKSNVLICSKEIDEIVSIICNINTTFYDVLEKYYVNVVQEIYSKYFDHIQNLTKSLTLMDVYNNKCKIIDKYNLCKPEIKDSKNSFVDSKKMRHILIENLDKNEIYVPNDIKLGCDDSDLGMLLYGTNAVGKTSLIKALGICVIMAQSGFYVPCESFVFNPYNYIFTRIIGNDNIFKGLSTFGVEMSELRVIINNCDNNSLILGDELCSGTEIDSALSIFTASLEIMTQRKVILFLLHIFMNYNN